MPRKTRMYLPDIPVHVIQRRNNGNARFFCEDEYRYFLDRLREGLGRFRVALHAYVLMTNHVHLLMTPRDAAGISRLMRHLGRHYVLYVNQMSMHQDKSLRPILPYPFYSPFLLRGSALGEALGVVRLLLAIPA